MSKNYLLEIGVEELPARFVGDALEQLQTNTSNFLKEERISYNSMKVYSTPRRLTLIVEGLEDKQEDLKETVKGPAKKIAFDSDGNPTKALLGFMRGQNIDIASIYVEEHNGIEYVYADVVKEGKEIEEILKGNIPNIIKSINFPL